MAEEKELIRAKARTFIAARDEALKVVAQIEDYYQAKTCKYDKKLVELVRRHKKKIAGLRRKVREKSALFQAPRGSALRKITTPARGLIKRLRHAIGISGRPAHEVARESRRERSKPGTGPSSAEAREKVRAVAPEVKSAAAQRRIDDASYRQWTRSFDELSWDDRELIRQEISTGDLPIPLVVLVFDAASAEHAKAAVKRLQDQLLERWEACLCFRPECPSEVIAAVEEVAETDGRLQVLRTPLAASSQFLGSSRDYVVLAPGGVLLREHALYMFASAAYGREACVVYSDEDRVDESGSRSDPFFKPRFSPELLRRTGYVGPCALLRRPGSELVAMIDDVLNGRRNIETCIEDAALRTGKDAVVHLPFVLYHDVRTVRPGRAKVVEIDLPEESLPTVSIIVATKNGVDLLSACLASIEKRTQYPRDKWEVVVVDNGSSDPETLRYLAESEHRGAIRVLRYPRPFNYSRINNLAVHGTSSDVVVLLNNDTLVDDAIWLRRLVSYAMQEDVGAVGPKLLFPDRTVQSGGTVLGIQGAAGHAHVGLGEHEGGYHNLANETHEVSAITGACLAVRRNIFNEVGGFDPALAVAFNDVLFCLETLDRGYRNLYLGAPLLLHLESKTRGYDDTPEKVVAFHKEADYVRRRYRAVFQDDPYYNPNLSLSYARDYALGFPPRRIKPWRSLARRSGKLRVLMLSAVHGVGYGVPVVLELQAMHLKSLGHEVFIGGPEGRNEFAYEGCQRIYLATATEAACFAVEHDIDCVIAHTPPFFSVARWVGDWPRTVLYDYGEPNPQLFPDAQERQHIITEKHFCFKLADRVYAISESVRAEAGDARVGVIRLGNSHLTIWSDKLAEAREKTRGAHKWSDKVVILNVCRFFQAERNYKGVDTYVSIHDEFGLAHPRLSENVVFVLCGKSSERDIRDIETCGIKVIANVSDVELIDLYAAADVYMNQSRWEDYNLGIGQALALGLPVIASDIPAHREFDVFTSNNRNEIISRLAQLATDIVRRNFRSERASRVWTWEEPLAQLAAVVENLCADDGDIKGKWKRTTEFRPHVLPLEPGVEQQGSDAGCS